MDDLAVYFRESGPQRFGLPHYAVDCPLKGIAVYQSVDPHEEPELPLRAGLARLLREPYV
ncbi:hypothetical protein A5752_12280 [Mycobacterium sp. 852002-51961_SCH5331710]|nr:hypothetical protein A5752_12280 [Mycobacterium sp. 852002-51961_SCH5331710]